VSLQVFVCVHFFYITVISLENKSFADLHYFMTHYSTILYEFALLKGCAEQ
jgi:hypothetical protein